ncbi:hypothetical protein ACFL5V_04585 [Fibrobacterota bacterium]
MKSGRAGIIILIVLSGLTCYADDFKSVCNDGMYLELKEKRLDDMTEKEFEMFKVKDEACSQERIAEYGGQEKSKTMKYAMYTIVGVASLLALYLIITLVTKE